MTTRRISDLPLRVRRLAGDYATTAADADKHRQIGDTGEHDMYLLGFAVAMHRVTADLLQLLEEPEEPAK